MILKVENLVKYFPIKVSFFGKKDYVKAVDNVSFNITKSQILGVVGESGCGKSTLAKTIIRLIEPNSGQVIFKGKNIFDFSKKNMLKFRREVQLIFQDPYSSLNPRMRVFDIINEPFIIHNIAKKKNEQIKIVGNLLNTVGLGGESLNKYPHEFSGGQRQRIGIARALALKPELIIADEPVSALDVSVQAQVINLLKNLQNEFKLTYIFITHNLSLVKYIADKVLVMYLGKIVEYSSKDKLFDCPKHPYSRALLQSIPIPDPDKNRKKIILKGDIPSPINPPKGCYFHPRCPKVMAKCKLYEPKLIELKEDLKVACHLYN